MSELLVERVGHVELITLNRPDRMNAITGTMLAAFSKALVDADRDNEVRAVVITGAGRGFCAGLDIKDQTSGKGLGVGASPGKFDLRDSPPMVLHNCDKPTLCALNGGAAGYGLDMALGCDIRIAADTAKLSAAFTKRGVLPESGGTWLLPRLIGWAKASEIAFTGRTLTADQALELGLINQVVPADLVLKETMAMANEIAENAPLAVQATKRMMRMAQDETFEANVHHVFLQLLPLFRTKDFQEGMKSFMEKRPAKFEGR